MKIPLFFKIWFGFVACMVLGIAGYQVYLLTKITPALVKAAPAAVDMMERIGR